MILLILIIFSYVYGHLDTIASLKEYVLKLLVHYWVAQSAHVCLTNLKNSFYIQILILYHTHGSEMFICYPVGFSLIGCQYPLMNRRLILVYSSLPFIPHCLCLCCVCVCVRACAYVHVCRNHGQIEHHESVHLSFPLKILLFQLLISSSKHLRYYELIFYCVMTSSKLILLLQLPVLKAVCCTSNSHAFMESI